MEKCAVYTRVSTDDQNTSIINQQNYFIDYIERNKWSLYDVYTDEAFTGTDATKRISFQRLLRDAKDSKYNILLAKSYSRFGRNMRETLDAISKLLECNVRIIFIEDNLDSKRDMNNFGLFSWLAEQEARKVSERIKITWEHYDTKGVIHACTAPFGYNYCKESKNFIVNEDEANVVREIFKFYTEKGYGYTKIANILSDRGIKTKKGGTWANPTIKSIISNQAYIGNLVQGKSKNIDVVIKKRNKMDEDEWKIHENNHEPIIDKDIFYRAQNQIGKRSVKSKYPRHSSVALFSNLIKCPYCGATFTIKRQKHFKNYKPYYSCITYELKGVKGAGHSRIAVYENTLVAGLKQYFIQIKDSNFELLKQMYSSELEKDKKDTKNFTKELKKIEKKINEINNLSIKSLKLLNDEVIGINQYKLQSEQFEKDLQALITQKEEVMERIRQAKYEIEDENTLSQSIEKLLEVDNWTNVMLKECIENINIYQDQRIHIKLKFNRNI